MPLRLVRVSALPVGVTESASGPASFEPRQAAGRRAARPDSGSVVVLQWRGPRRGACKFTLPGAFKLPYPAYGAAG